MEPTTDDEPLLLDTTTADRASSMVFTVNDKSTTASGTHILASPLEQDNEYPDGGFDAWMAVFASFIFHFLAVGINYAFGVYANYYSRMGLASMSVLSFIGATAVFFMVGLGIVSGRLAEKFGFRSMMTAGTTLLCSGLFVASFCTQVWELILTQGVLFGVGMSVAYFPAVSLPSQWFEKRRGLATGIAVSGSGIGGLFMSLVTQELLGSIGFAWTMRITALAVFVGVMAVLPFVKTRVPSVPQSKTDWTVLKDRRFLLLLATSFFATFSNLIPVYYLPPYAIDVLGTSGADAAVLISIYNGSSAIGRILIGIGADTLVGRLNSLILCMFLSATSMLFIWAFAGSYNVLVLFAVVNGFVCGGFISLFPVVVGHIFGVKRLPSLIGTLLSISAIANLSGTPAAGVVRDYFGYPGLTLFSGSATAVSLLFAVAVRAVEQPRLRAVV